jgi:hypothetical protein
MGWMFVLHHLVGRPQSLSAPRWTLWRLFSYGRLTPTRAGRMALWQKMCQEGGRASPGSAHAYPPTLVGELHVR